MPFINNGEVALTTYNDVGRDQIIYNISTTSTVGPVALTAFRFGKPNIPPFSKFIDLLLEAQTAFQDITPFFPHHQPIRKLGVELSSALSNTTLVGLLVENILEEKPWYWQISANLRFFQTIASRVEKYTDVIEKFVDDIRLFHAGLQFTLIGSLWRRVFWSIMWHLSEDSDITRIVQQTLQQFASFQQQLNLLIDTLGKNKAIYEYLIPAQSGEIFEQLFVNNSKVVHHLATPRARLNLFDGSCYLDNSGCWRPSTFEIDICLDYFSSFSDLQSLVNTSMIVAAPAKDVDLVDVSNHRLITAETSELLAASTSSLEIQQIQKVSYISSKPMTDQCPRCNSLRLCNGPVSGWHVCPQCYIRIRHRNYQHTEFNTEGMCFNDPLFEDSRYVDWIHVDPQSLPQRLTVGIEPHLMEPLLHFTRSTPVVSLRIDASKSLAGLRFFHLEIPRHDVIPNIKELTLDLRFESIHLPNVSLPNLEELSIWGFGGLPFKVIVTWVLSHPSIRSLNLDVGSDYLWTFSSFSRLLPGLPLLGEFRFYGVLTPEESHQLYDHIQEMKLLGHPIEELRILWEYCCCWDRLRKLGVTVG